VGDALVEGDVVQTPGLLEPAGTVRDNATVLAVAMSAIQRHALARRLTDEQRPREWSVKCT
jgi:hypothetical protein